MPAEIASPLILTVSLATITMLILLALATPLAWWLATARIWMATSPSSKAR